MRSTVDASLQLMDDLEAQIQSINKQLRALSLEHRYMPLLGSAYTAGLAEPDELVASVGRTRRVLLLDGSGSRKRSSRGHTPLPSEEQRPPCRSPVQTRRLERASETGPKPMGRHTGRPALRPTARSADA